MSRLRVIEHVALVGAVILLSACAESLHQVQRDTELFGIPPELEKEIDPSVRFADLTQKPDEYIGRTVMVGGTVIQAKRKANTTEVEVLQLPTVQAGEVTEDRLRSEGRFLAVQDAFLDPATLPEGTPITIIGTVTGQTTRAVDESPYTYPVLEIKHIIDWNRIAAERRRDRFPDYGMYAPPYGGSGFYPYGLYGGTFGSYWGGRYWGGPGFYRPYPYYVPRSTPSPSPPPRSVHPRLRGR